jgi:hypothetical protein
VLDVPELGFMPDECVIGRPLGLRTLREPCAVPVSAVRQRNARYTQYVRALQQRIPSLEVLDAATTFCDTTLCHARRGRHLLYSDANHLTAAGGRLVFERLRPHLALTPRTMADGRATGSGPGRRQVAHRANPVAFRISEVDHVSYARDRRLRHGDHTAVGRHRGRDAVHVRH